MSSVKSNDDDVTRLTDADVEQVSGGLSRIAIAAIGIFAAESCVRDKWAH